MVVGVVGKGLLGFIALIVKVNNGNFIINLASTMVIITQTVVIKAVIFITTEVIKDTTTAAVITLSLTVHFVTFINNYLLNSTSIDYLHLMTKSLNYKTPSKTFYFSSC